MSQSVGAYLSGKGNIEGWVTKLATLIFLPRGNGCCTEGPMHAPHTQASWAANIDMALAMAGSRLCPDAWFWLFTSIWEY